jgi:steroid delta-isomerase-like uncharacterized protein
MSPKTLLSQDQLIASAKAPLLGYNAKDWAAVQAGITKDFVYDEVATRRKVQGAEETIAVWKGWAAAFPDSKATFDKALVAGETVVFELTWRGTHTGPLQTPSGTIPPTGKSIEVRGCAIQDLAGDRVRTQRHYFDMATLLEQLGVKG